MAKKVLILGAEGMLGSTLFKTFQATKNYLLSGTQRKNQNMSDFFGVGQTDIDLFLEKSEPDIVINCIGVVKQSKNQNDLGKMSYINGEFPIELAEKLKSSGTKLFHISTDCVFSGLIGNYSESDKPDPLDDYGLSKLKGEDCSKLGAMVMRTSIIGHEKNVNGKGLLSWFLNNQNLIVPGYTNAYFSGLTTGALSTQLVSLVASSQHESGVWHVSGERISKLELLKLLQPVFRPEVRIVPTELPILDRSLNDQQFRSRFGLYKPSWEQMIKDISMEEF